MAFKAYILLIICPLLCFAVPPDAPTVRLYSYDTSKIIVVWDPPANDGGSPITLCSVFMKLDQGAYSPIASLTLINTQAIITTFNAAPLQASPYSIYATATNAHGTSPDSPVVTINLQAPTSSSKSSVVSPPTEVTANTPFTLTIQSYDDAGNKKTTGGDYMIIAIGDVCTVPGSEFRCVRVGTGDPHYVPDIFTALVVNDQTDNGDGTYSSSFTLPKAGYATVGPILYKQGGLRIDVAYSASNVDAMNFVGSWSFFQITPQLNWPTLADIPGGAPYLYMLIHGRLRPPVSADYTFYVTPDDYYQLFINGNLIVDAPYCAAASGGTHLNRHAPYDIYMRYCNAGGIACLLLDWTSAQIAQTNVPPQYWWYPERIGTAPFDIKILAPPTASKCTITGLTPAGSIWEDCSHNVKITTVWDATPDFQAMPNTYVVKIIGPSPEITEVSYTPTDIGSYVYSFDYTINTPGQYQLSITLGGSHIQNSPLSFTVNACHKYCVGCTGALNTDCLACNPAEEAFPAVGVPTTCDICHPGYKADAGYCVKCSAGYYQDLEKEESCKQCDPGTVQPNDGQASCNDCLAGTVQPLSGKAICDDCLEGQYQNEQGKTACLPCPIGKFNPSKAQATCTDCIAGEYQNEEGKLSCIPCPLGTYSPTTGYSQCILCEPGKYQDQTGKSSCKECSPGYYQLQSGTTGCVKCPIGTYSDTNGASECKVCNPGWYPNTVQSACLYKGIFVDIPTFANHAMASACFDANGAIIKPFTNTCRDAYHTACCQGSSKLANTDCNFGLELASYDPLYDLYCKACPFMDQAKCPTNGICWDDTAWINNAVSPYSGMYSLACLEAIEPYCGLKFNSNINDPECSVFKSSCSAAITDSRYMSFWEKFRITVDKKLPSSLPNCNQIFDLSISPQIASGKLTCTRISDYIIEVNIANLASPINSYRLAQSFLKDACGIYIPSDTTKTVITPSPVLETLVISGTTTDKCLGLTITAQITVFFYSC